jgi:hypothetical protein
VEADLFATWGFHPEFAFYRLTGWRSENPASLARCQASRARRLASERLLASAVGRLIEALPVFVAGIPK